MSENNFAKIDDVRVGTILIADGGFSCMDENVRLVVVCDDDGNLSVPCRMGGHDLAGQIENDHYVGLSLG